MNNAPVPVLTRAEFDRIDEAVLAVLQRPDMFTGAEVDFAHRMVDELEELGIYVTLSADEWGVVERIESVAFPIGRAPTFDDARQPEPSSAARSRSATPIAAKPEDAG